VILCACCQKPIEGLALDVGFAAPGALARMSDEERRRHRIVADSDLAVIDRERFFMRAVLHVPIHAIVPEAGKHLAFVVQNGQPVEREVKIGKNNAHYVQVLEGLAEGEEVLLYDPRAEGQGTEGSPKEEAQPAKSLPGAPAE